MLHTRQRQQLGAIGHTRALSAGRCARGGRRGAHESGASMGGAKRRRTSAASNAPGPAKRRAIVAPPITLEQLAAVVRAGSANVRSDTQDALDKANNRQQTSWLESVLEKLEHYSSLGAVARQVKNGCVENGCGMTYPQVAAELQKTCSDSQLRPFYIEQWKRQQGHVLGLPPPANDMCCSAHAFVYLLAPSFAAGPRPSLDAVKALRSDFSNLAKENTGHSCLGQEQVVAVTRGRGCATLGAKRSAAGSAAGHPGARRPRVCAAAAVCMLEAGRRWPCIFDPSHTYI